MTVESEEVDPDWPPPAPPPFRDVEALPPTSGAGRSLYLVAALAILVCIVAVVAVIKDDGGGQPAPSPAGSTAASPPAASRPSAAAPGRCGPDQTAAIAAALSTVPADRKTGKPWSSTPESAHYDPCADLSAVVVTVQDGTRSSPDLALMFHRGAFVGTATPKAFPFTEIEGAASMPELVVLTYRTRQSCDSCDDGTLTIVGFAWKGDKVQMLDSPPESLDAPP